MAEPELMGEMELGVEREAKGTSKAEMPLLGTSGEVVAEVAMAAEG